MKNKFQRILALILAMTITIPGISMAKGTTNESGISLMSLFPIEEVNAYIDLTEIPLELLPQMTTSDLFSYLRDSDTKELIEIDSNATSVWENFFNNEGEYLYDTWKVLKFGDSVNVLDHYIEDDYNLEVIIGSGNQLDTGNVRYFVDFQMPSKYSYMDLSGYIYDSLYDFNTTEIVQNIPDLKINDMQSVEILWYVGDLIESGYKFKHNATNGWLKFGYGETEKFAPTLEERYTCDWWSNSQRMIIKYDDTAVMYRLNTTYPEYIDMFEFSLYTQDDTGKRNEIELDEIHGYESKSTNTGRDIYYYEISSNIKSYHSDDSVYYLGMKLNETFADYELKVINGWEHSEDKIRSWIRYDQIPLDIDITKNLVAPDMSLTDTGLKDYWLGRDGLEIMICVVSDNELYIIPATIGVYRNYDYVDVNGIFTNKDGERIAVDYDVSYDYEEHLAGAVAYYTDVVTYYLKKGYNCNDEYSIGMTYYNGDSHDSDSKKVVKAVVGHYTSLEEAKDKPDIKKQLFAEDMYSVDSGYKADFSGDGVEFTIFSADDVWYFRVRAEESNYEDEPDYDEEPDIDQEPEYDGAPEVGAYDSHFRVYDLYNGDYTLDTYIVPYEYDTYYSYGYQTLLINDTDVDMSSISPLVNLADNAKVYYGDTMENTDDSYYNKLSPRDFTKAPADVKRDPLSSVRYTVSAQNQANQKNYWVTAAKKEEGAKLFVNGPDEREIFLNNYFGNVHDIFIANIGSEELTGISATLEATNVKLDDYWSVGKDGNNTLAPFTTTANDTQNVHGELFNIARIRLIPDGEGEITGTLTITADGHEPRIINLTGIAGNPKIDTAAIHDAVKYVPYSSIITTNNMHYWNKVTFSLYEGTLPEGLTLYPSGEIYGVPKETGQFPITIKAGYSHSEFEASYANLVLTVKDNTDDNINASVDDGYEITTRLPSTISEHSDREFVIDGEFSEFIDLWLDGEKLVVDTDYTARAGSTKITIKSKTFSNAGKGKHTISAEFRVNGNNRFGLRTASQNFFIADASSVISSGGGGGGGSSSYVVTFDTNGGNQVKKQNVKRGSKISDLPTPVKEGYVFAGWFKDKTLTKPFDSSEKITSKLTLYAKWNIVIPDKPLDSINFDDVTDNDWFYEDVQWAYSNNVMVGYSDTQFAPSETITNTMVVTVLARLANVDITAYENKQIEDVAVDQWYTPYSNWAKEAGIADDISFISSAPITREMMGVVLVRFFDYMETEFAVSEEFIEFADAQLISDKAMNALQTLYKLEIFRGKGDNIIDPLGNTTRAEFAALIHRVHTLLNKSTIDRVTA